MCEILWQTDAHNITPRNALDQFCRTYWDKPRKPRAVAISSFTGTFQVVDGVRTYKIALDDKQLPSVWVISVNGE